MSLTFIHTADWQIGKQFAEIGGDAASVLRLERIEAIKRIAKLATERSAAAVLVAGDLFETNAVADETVRRVVNALGGFRGPWLLLPGNHDPCLAESAWSRMARLGLPDNVVLLGAPTPWVAADGRIAVLPAPLQRKREIDDLTEWFDRAATPEGAARIGLAHGSVTNRLPEKSEAGNRIADDRAATARLDYLALGDWHGTLEIAPRTWYAGTPEPDRYRDNDPGNALVVTLREPGAPPDVEKVRTGRFHWQCEEISVVGADAAATVGRALDAAASATPPDSLLLWLRLSGAVGLEDQVQLREVLEERRARLFHLRVDDDHLLVEPSDEDLDRIDRGGFIRTAVDVLRQRAADPGDPERHTARRALQLLYVEHCLADAGR